MNSSLRNLLGLTLLVAPLAAGCASRTAPFDQMDQAQITVMRLQQPAPPPVAAVPGAAPSLFPGVPGLDQLGQQAAAAAQAAGIPIPPGLIPGVGTPQQPAQTQPQLPMFNGMAIAASMPVSSDDMKDELLDLFGDEDSFQPGNMGCNQAPGMGISMVRQGQPNVDLMVSFTCGRAMGVGFAWPHKADGLTNESRGTLTKIYQALFAMQPPPGA
ncbi:hypothetical protein [Polyangium aurulentum]|uniref:hypothetical protein n=1 Tax=Polyangium aurulentum TaxID=2567896 RepID=UPI0010AE448F|nr:hypothetical protein [Polyangium aurulentum]UQA56272.1 hypothetical protein E8A73_033890 [Polyangium aurulentum]